MASIGLKIFISNGLVLTNKVDVNMPQNSISIGWRIHDNWTEILEGTSFLLSEGMINQGDSIQNNIITRSIFIHSHQLVEVMLFNSAKKYLEENSETLDTKIYDKFYSDLDDNIGIKKALMT